MGDAKKERARLERSRAALIKRGIPAATLASIQRLTRTQRENVEGWMCDLYDLEDALEAPDPAPLAPGERADREVVERAAHPRKLIVYQLELVRCGKARCRCMNGGKGHGPYWYAYQRSGGRMTSRYIGKKAPGSVWRARKRKAVA